MREIRMKGRTTEEAIESGLKVLGVKRAEVEVNIISEGKSGVLGVFGGEEAEVEIKVKTEPKEEARDILQAILDKMGLMALVNCQAVEDDTMVLEIKGEDLGRIIGREGATIEALGLLVGSILSKQAGARVRVAVDAAGYRLRRQRRLERMAEEAAEEVASTGKEVLLPPMPAVERRIIHMTLAAKPEVFSFSRGERDLRRVVIAPKGEEKGEPGGN